MAAARIVFLAAKSGQYCRCGNAAHLQHGHRVRVYRAARCSGRNCRRAGRTRAWLRARARPRPGLNARPVSLTVPAAAKKRLVVLLSGRGSNFAAIHGAISQNRLDAQILAVISDRPDARGLDIAAQTGMDTVCEDREKFPDRRAFERSLAAAVAGFEPDHIVLAGFMRVLSASFVNRFPCQIINIHPSLLPRHRGLHTHRRVLEAGEKKHGASVHIVTPELDAGPVISQVIFEVNSSDTADTLAERLLPLEHRLYPRSEEHTSELQSRGHL